MARTKTLTRAQRGEVLWIVRGYRERVQAYKRRRSVLLCRARKGHDQSALLERLETCMETRKLRAVEHAAAQIGQDIAADGLRERLRRAITANLEDGRENTYEYLALDGISRTAFYRYRERFLTEVAVALEIIAR